MHAQIELSWWFKVWTGGDDPLRKRYPTHVQQRLQPARYGNWHDSDLPAWVAQTAVASNWHAGFLLSGPVCAEEKLGNDFGAATRKRTAGRHFSGAHTRALDRYNAL